MYKRRKGRKLINSTKITIDNIKFDSTLESKMYKLLKEASIENTHNSITYTIVDGFTYKSDCYSNSPARVKSKKPMLNSNKVRSMTYVPDFVALDQSWIIEVKGRANESFPLRWKMFKSVVNGWEKPPVLFLPSNVKECEEVVEIIKGMKK